MDFDYKDKLNRSYLFILLILSILVFFTAYIYPRSTFWDENYYACAVFKYLNGVFFFESHPPLGKMIMSLGELIMPINQKIDTSVFLDTNYLKKFPKNFSFAGLRLFPNLFNVANTFLFFGIVLFLVKNRHIAFFLTSLYLFNNGYMLHSRGAMIDSTQIFFVLIAILYFFKVIHDRDINNKQNKKIISQSKQKINKKKYFLLAIPLALAITTKLNASIFLLLFVFLFFIDYSKETKKITLFLVSLLKNIFEKKYFSIKEQWQENYQNLFFFLKSLFVKSIISILGLTLVIFVVFYTHAKLGPNVHKNKYYKASKEYRSILDKKRGISFYHIPLVIKDYYNYMIDYHSRVPKLDKCKPQGENGSHPMEWILGSKAIKYSWYGVSGGGFYLYSVPNFLVVLFGLFGIISSISLVLAVFLFGLPIQNKESFIKILCFIILYLVYMSAMLSIDRVMYLYHYFLPTFLSLFMGFSVFRYLFYKEIDQNNRKVYTAVMIFTLQVIIIFIYFGNFSYGWFSTINDFTDKTWLPIWNLKF